MQNDDFNLLTNLSSPLSSLKSNNIGDAGAAAIGEGLKRNTTLTDLRYGFIFSLLVLLCVLRSVLRPDSVCADVNLSL